VSAPGAFLLSIGLLAPAAVPGQPARAATRPDIVLVTLDTTRADALGCYGGAARTPVLDALAAGGVRFARALAPAPLTLPAHASLLTGLDPNQHGLRDNGGGALPRAARSIASALGERGYATVAAVGSRVLDRRFGLDRGFDVYDDRMVAERLGEFGYAERPAAEVVDALARAVAVAAAGRPLFVWAHFYDPHAPYAAPGADERARYHAEIEAVDRELGRLLDRLPAGRPRWVIVVGDHGESFGEHGEQEHGYLLHEPTLAVPLIVSGPGAAAPGRVIRAPVAARRVAATIAEIAGVRPLRDFGEPLPLVAEEEPRAVYHETEFPASTFGWSPLAAVTRGSWRLVEGPKPALFDLAADPGEGVNRLESDRERARALLRELRALQRRPALAPEQIAHDAALGEALASLGYLSGATNRRGTLDPAEGVLLLGRYAAARERLARGDPAGARAELRELVARSPGSAPFLTQLARAERALGDLKAARAALASALATNPANEFLWAMVGDLERDAGNPAAAEAAYREAVRRSPRMASAWVALGEILGRTGRADEELAVLRAAVAAECESAVVFARLAEVELGRGELAAAEEHGGRATALMPQWAAAWQVWARVAVAAGRGDLAAERQRRAQQLAGR
jgi:arylsulfatase A-like enzyme/Tfp pilus assembly protein PilF